MSTTATCSSCHGIGSVAWNRTSKHANYGRLCPCGMFATRQQAIVFAQELQQWADAVAAAERMAERTAARHARRDARRMNTTPSTSSVITTEVSGPTMGNDRAERLFQESGIEDRFRSAVRCEARYLMNMGVAGRYSEGVSMAISAWPHVTSPMAKAVLIAGEDA